MNFTPVIDLIKRLPKKIRHEWMAHTIAVNLAAQIRGIRKARGWTQRQFAERVGMAQSYVARLETAYGAGHASISTLCRVAAAFDVALQVRFCSWGEWIDYYITPYGAFIDEGLRPSTFDIPTFAEDIAMLENREDKLQDYE